jgi:rhodanese-related sulfurtransferase
MTYVIRNALAILAMAMIISGCAGPQQTVSTSRGAAHSSTRSARGPAGMISVRSDETPDQTPVGPTTKDEQHDITLEQIHEHVRNGTAVVIDARTTELYARGHVRGSINLPAGEVAKYLPQFEQAVGRDQFIIIYCNGPRCGSSDMVYEYLAAQGYTNMRVFSPGWLKLASAKALR